MNETLTKLRQTRASSSAAAIRILLGLLFLSTGVMKFAVPNLRAAFSGQLTAAGIPFHSLNMWIVPAVEVGIGVLFILGFLSRLASLSAMVMMAVATYVHLVVDDPTLFPLQPEAPIIPLVVIGASAYLIWLGGGAWSLDLRAAQRAPREKGSLTKRAKLLVAQSMYEKGKNFIGAAVLLRKQGGYEYVVLHLLCQGIEIVLKSFLLFHSYDSYQPRMRKLGHNLERITDRVLALFKLKPLPHTIRSELRTLNSLYAKQFLRYASFYDVLVDPSTIPSERASRKILAAIRLANRHLQTYAPPSAPLNLPAASAPADTKQSV
jgi:putative oxidoreductase